MTVGRFQFFRQVSTMNRDGTDGRTGQYWKGQEGMAYGPRRTHRVAHIGTGPPIGEGLTDVPNSVSRAPHIFPYLSRTSRSQLCEGGHLTHTTDHWY